MKNNNRPLKQQPSLSPTNHVGQTQAGRRVALGLSGGVDSAVCAALLKGQGYDVTAVYLECWRMPGCRTKQDQADALKIALQLEIPFTSLNFIQAYQDQVMSYFVDEYHAGRTPNPDVLCNNVIKFGLFYDWAMKQGYDYVATGHYAQIEPGDKTKTIPTRLVTSVDLHKDQTYFLHQIKQKQLNHVLFPIGHLTKVEVRAKAHQLKLPVADKKDSVGICFVGEINVAEFLEEKLGKNPGNVITPNGKVVGRHQGLWFYTIGQRRGFELDVKAVKHYTDWVGDGGNVPPLFVTNKKGESNELVIGPELAAYTSQFTVNKIHWINADSDWTDLPLLIRIRHTGELVPCKLVQLASDKLRVTPKKPIRGVAAGQFAVWYVDTNQILTTLKNRLVTNGRYVCLGGGVIE